MKTVLAGLMVITLAGCQALSGIGGGKQARAMLDAKSGSNVAGEVDFQQAGEQVHAFGKVTGLKPGSEHGFHIHEKGDCSAADATSAGGHFNPTGEPHGHPTQAKRHAGDMRNLTADDKGEANFSYKLDGVRLDDSQQGIFNRAVVVHAKPDDYTTQPSGDSGGRIACGLIKKR